MAIDVALSSALSGLLTSQQALQVVSDNIANVNNANYSVKTLQEESRDLAGIGAGVQIQGITRSVNQGLDNSLNQASGTLNQLQTADTFNSQIQNLFGTPGTSSSISSLVQNLATSLQTLASSGDQAPSDAVNAAQEVTSSLQAMTTQVQGLRVQADQQIATAVQTVNTTLGNIANLNNEIATSIVSGQDVADLEDQRDAQLSTLSQYMNFTSFTRPDGTLSLYTTQGTPLLENAAQTVDFTGSSQIEPQMAYSPTGNGVLSGITVNGIDITGQIKTGQLGALLGMRDSTLPNLQSQIDTLSQNLQNVLNQVNNAGTAWPNGGQNMVGSTTFINPSQQTISLSGGDTAVVLFDGSGNQIAGTTVSTLAAQYNQSNNLPPTNPISITNLASSLNGWLNTQYNTSGITYAQVNSAGHFVISLPQTSSTTIGFRDQQTVTFQGSASSDNQTSANGGQAMGLTGPLTFRDSAGNVYSVTVAAGDSLQDIANKINAISPAGLTASLVPSTSNSSLYQLQVTNTAGNDMTLDPDTAGNNAVSGLGLAPSGAQAAQAVSVEYNNDGIGTSVLSQEYASGSSVINQSGVLNFTDSLGQIASVTLNPSWTVSQLAAAISTASGGRVSAGVTTIGNQVALSVTDVAGNQMQVSSPDSTTSQKLASGFGAAAGTLSLAVDGTTYGPLTVTGMTTAQIATAINTQPAFSGSGITASVQTDGSGNTALTLTAADGSPITVTDSVPQFGFTQNSNAVNALGLTTPPDQMVSGFSNFLGLNDLLVTNQPNTVFDTQTLTGNYTTSSTTNLDISDATFVNGNPATGQPMSLNINFIAGQTLSSLASQINSQAVVYDGLHTPIGSFSATSASTLNINSGETTLGNISVPAGSSLADIAKSINANSALSSAGVVAMVATDGSSEWLRVYDQQGKPLSFGGSAYGTGAGQVDPTANQLVTASVVADGSGQRLRITHTTNSELQLSGTLSSQTGLGVAAVGNAQNLTVSSNIANDPSLLSHGMVQYNASTNSYYVGSTDNSALTAMVNALTNPINMPSAGGLGQGNISLTQYGANIVAASSANASANSTQLTYQQTLVSNLTTQKGSVSGVNMDEELSNLITYQQSYQASAKVISTMQNLLDVLDNIIH